MSALVSKVEGVCDAIVKRELDASPDDALAGQRNALRSLGELVTRQFTSAVGMLTFNGLMIAAHAVQDDNTSWARLLAVGSSVTAAVVILQILRSPLSSMASYASYEAEIARTRHVLSRRARLIAFAGWASTIAVFWHLVAFILHVLH